MIAHATRALTRLDMRAEGEVEGEDDDDDEYDEEDEGEKEVGGEQEEEEKEYGYEGDEEERRRWGGRNMEGPISSPVPGLSAIVLSAIGSSYFGE